MRINRPRPHCSSERNDSPQHAPERDRLIIGLHRVKDQRARYAAVAESLAARFPGEAAGHLALAQVRFAAGDFLGAVASARRVLALDALARAEACHACDASVAMVYSYIYADSLAAAERTARELLRLRPRYAQGWSGLSAVLGRRGLRADALAAYQRAESLEPDALDRWIPIWLALLADDYAAANRYVALQIQLDGANSESHWRRIMILRNQGKLLEALAAARELTRVDAPRGGLAEAQVLFELGRYREAAARFELSARESAGSAKDFPGESARRASWNLTHAATAWAASGDTLRLAQLADTVQSIAHLSAYGRDWRLPAHIRGLLWQTRGVPQRAMSEFRAALFSPSEGFTRTNLEFARALLTLGRAPAAVAVLQPALRGSVDGSNFYVTRTALHEALATAFEAAQQPDSAAVHYAIVASSWSTADPPLRPRAEAARRKVEALQ